MATEPERWLRQDGSVRFRRRRDVVRRCVRCGETWTVPGALARPPRVSKWQRGISLPEHNTYGGMTTNATASYRLEEARRRSDRLDTELGTVSAFGTCPACGAVGAYVETPAPRD